MYQEDDSQEFQIPEYPEQIYNAKEYPLKKKLGFILLKKLKKKQSF
jgi:hypothetical protein